MLRSFWRNALLAGVLFGIRVDIGSAQTLPSAVQTRLQAVLDSFQRNPANPYIGGISAAVRIEGVGQWEGATGFAARNIDAQNNLLPGGTPFAPDTLARMYSVTKTFTAALILELAEEGYFHLGDSIGTYLPLRTINPQLSGAVTIRQLLSHQSGFSDYVFEQEFLALTAAQPTRNWEPEEIVATARKIDEVGARRKYSSTNYILLGMLAEAVTQTPAAELYRTRFFEPLGLSSMYFAATEPRGNRGKLAAPHENVSQFNPIFQLTQQPLFPDTVTNISRLPFEGVASAAYTGGAMVSTARDMAAWGAALYGGRATSQAVLDTMVNSLYDAINAGGDYLGYGITADQRINDHEFFYGHGGAAPGYRALLGYQPDKRITLAVMSNYGGGDPFEVARRLFEVLPADLVTALDAADLSGSGAMQFFPNPATDHVTWQFTPAHPMPVQLEVYDLRGVRVKTLFRGMVHSATEQQFSTVGLSAGTYVVRLQTAAGSFSRKLVIR
ncbi:Por secretion system C-terminal sorting domain-containing protein [Catalinimonas alkaloidigena]|uniref:Por secretion system C-terminal sorting domain-containing protein n=1 Tax=Catalinimonas alkaloidigena TaxID=1075417 RepID=A0A1G9SBK8_9BACT|nr:serine hydrolase [Catalinimonas alkaloidigena]SDM32854.1 Por secretion system C-terminal sorting domain-containing protein [Catalinimonas alkaloidigena]